MVELVRRYPFTDPARGVMCTLLVRPDMPAWQGTTVEHPGCLGQADVSFDLDCYHCTTCSQGGRLSGAWAIDMVSHARASLEAVDPPEVRKTVPTPLNMLTYPFRWALARSGGYFWLPCPLCGRKFAGFQWRRVRAGQPASIPREADPSLGQGICPTCTRRGLGFDRDTAEELSR